ncbi:MAG: response regulator [Dehalococcoidia bacterium]|nr:response regulator [Dehalococcoidia bacterium]
MTPTPSWPSSWSSTTKPAVRKVCRRMLALIGLEVETPANGEEARQMASSRHYDLYLVDLRMPVLDGKQFYRWLEAEQPQSVQRVVFMTGSTASEETASFLKSTGRAFLLKPFSMADLEQTVRKALKAAT